MKADALRYPVLYQATGTTTLAPFPLTVATQDSLDVDIAEYRPGQRIDYTVRAYTTGPVTFTVHGFRRALHADIDGQPLAVTGNSFTATLADPDPHKISVSA
jgi:hypothetical protein